MASLTGNLISDTYQSLLKVGNNSTASAAMLPITDGLGNTTALALSTTAVKITGSIVIVNPNSTSSFSVLGHENLLVNNKAGTIGVYTDMHGISVFSGSNFIDITVNGTDFQNNAAGSLISVANASGDPFTVVQFENYNTFVSGTLSITAPLRATSGSIITGSLIVTETIAGSGLDITGSIAVQATGSINLNGVLSFTEGAFILPTTPAPIPVVGSAYFEPTSGSLYIYNGSTYLSVALS
jgi:hypothetical protein